MILFLPAFLYWICWLHPGGNQCFHEHRQQCQQQQQQQEQQQQWEQRQQRQHQHCKPELAADEHAVCDGRWERSCRKRREKDERWNPQVEDCDHGDRFARSAMEQLGVRPGFNNISRIIIVDIADCLLDAPPLLKRQTKAVMHKMRTLRNYELLLWIQSWRRLSWALVQSPISLHSLRACPCLPGWRWSEPWRKNHFFLSESCLIIATMSRLPVRCLPTVTATTWSSDSTDSWSDPRWSQLDSL